MDRSSSNIAIATFSFACGAAAGFLVSRRGVSNSTKNLFTNRPKYVPGKEVSVATGVPINFGTAKEVFNPSSLSSCYNLMISSVTPRPIALVSSRSSTTTSAVDNVAPFSYFGAVAHDPPMLTIGFCRQGAASKRKDTINNILATKQFVVNIMSEWYIDAANHSCGSFAPNVDEFEACGLTKVDDCEVVNAPRVGEAAVSYECELVHVHTISNDKGNETTEIVLAKVVRIHVDSSVLVDDGYNPAKPEVNTSKLRPLGRLGGNMYSSIGDTVDIPRPKV